MYSKPDFLHKQILFINNLSEETNSLSFSNENVVFKKDDRIINQTSCHRVWCIIILGNFTLTTKLIEKLQKFGISLALLNRNFDLYAQIDAEAKGNYILRAHQYDKTEFQELELAKLLIINKVHNQLNLIYNKFEIKNSESKEKYKLAKQKVKHQIESVKTNNELLAIEGFYAKNYYSQIFADLNWSRRAPRTKEDIPNLLLDIGYTFLFNLVNSLLCLHGFDTYKGFYHKLFFQRKSLACDLMEPFRPLIDWQLVKAYNLKQIDPLDFSFNKGSYSLDYKKSKKYTSMFLQLLLDHKMELFDYIRQYYYFEMQKPNTPFPTYKFNIR